MFCSNCGTLLSDGTRFCPKCGTPQAAASQPMQNPPQQAQPQQAPVYAPYPPNPPVIGDPAPIPSEPASEKKPKNKKLPLIIGLAAGGGVLVIALIAIIAALLTRGGNPGKNYIMVGDPYTVITELDTVFETDETYYLTDGDRRIELSSYPDTVMYSRDRTQGAFIDYPDEYYDSEDWIATLYHFDKNGTVQIAEDVDDYYQMSADGSTVVYVEEGFSGDAVIHIWKNGNDQTIDTMSYLDGIVISPDGSTILYRGENASGDKEAYLYRNGKTTEVEHKDADTAYVFAVTNDGSLIYHSDKNGEGFYVYDGKEDIRLGKDSYYYSEGTYFNYDCTQVIYHENGKTYLWKQGDDDPTKLSDHDLYPIFPNNIQYFLLLQDAPVYTFGIKEFRNIFLEDEDDEKCLFLDRKLELNDVIKGFDYIQLANDGKTLVVLKRDDLYKFDGTKDHKDTSKLIVAEDFVGFNMTPDAKHIYLINDYGDLYYLEGANKTVRLAEEIDESDWFYPSSRVSINGRIYFTCDGELHYAIGKDVYTIEGFKGEAQEIYLNGNNVFLYTEDDDEYIDYSYHVSSNNELTLQNVWDW